MFITLLQPIHFIGNIEQPPQNLTTEVGSPATFMCETNCPESIAFEWTFDGNPINPSDPRFNLTKTSGLIQIHTLIFTAEPQDNGRDIQCQITFSLNMMRMTVDSASAFLTLTNLYTTSGTTLVPNVTSDPVTSSNTIVVEGTISFFIMMTMLLLAYLL